MADKNATVWVVSDDGQRIQHVKRTGRILSSLNAETISAEQERLRAYVEDGEYQAWAYEYLSRSSKEGAPIVVRYDPQPVEKPKQEPKYFHSHQPRRRSIVKRKTYSRWSKL